MSPTQTDALTRRSDLFFSLNAFNFWSRQDFGHVRFLFQSFVPSPAAPFLSMLLINGVKSLRLIRRQLGVKGPPHKPSITNAQSLLLTSTYIHRYTHAHQHEHTHWLRFHPSRLVAGLSEVSVISCPAWLNYDVNKSPLVSWSTPTSESTRVGARTHTHPCTLIWIKLACLAFRKVIICKMGWILNIICTCYENLLEMNQTQIKQNNLRIL